MSGPSSEKSSQAGDSDAEACDQDEREGERGEEPDSDSGAQGAAVADPSAAVAEPISCQRHSASVTTQEKEVPEHANERVLSISFQRRQRRRHRSQ